MAFLPRKSIPHFYTSAFGSPDPFLPGIIYEYQNPQMIPIFTKYGKDSYI